MSLARSVNVVSPLGPGVLLFLSMSGRDALGRPFAWEVELLSDQDDLDLSALLGQTMTIELDQVAGGVREFTGLVTDFSLVGELGRYVRYRALLRPWLWLLTHTTNSRIYQNLTVPDVVKQIFREHGFTDFEEALSAEYRTWEYLVQYRESDFNFVSRILEQEGIYYYFKHAQGKHVLVLSDSYSAHEVTPGYELVPYYPPQQGQQRERDHIDGWLVSRRIRPGAFAAMDFDFQKPSAKLLTRVEQPNEHTLAHWELYDYPGEYREMPEGDAQVRLRLEEHQGDFETIQGSANARGFHAGGLFGMYGFPREDQNKEYLLVETAYELQVTGYESGSDAPSEPDYRCRFTAIDSKRPYRAPRVTPKPVVDGPQTAIVVGQAEQEIWTDQYARVKVQFHWDRMGQYDENSSCWIRVAQLWAGSGWGGIHIPRIGQEVIVDFLEGDPNRPIITGRVYNADNMPPYELPANQTQSGIKSRSTKEGAPSNFNEIRFEDKKGDEELYMQAEKNHTTLVKNDQSTSVKKNRSASVGGNDSVSVTGDRSVSVDGNLSVTVKGGGKGAPHSSLSVTGKHNVHASDTIDMDAPTHINLVCGGSSIKIEPGKITISAGGGASVVLDANILSKASGGGSLLIDPNVLAKSNGGGSVLVDQNVLAKSSAGHSALVDGGKAQLSAGGSAVDVTPSSIAINSTVVTGSGGGSALELASAGATMSGAKVSVSGSAVTEITGAVVKIN